MTTAPSNSAAKPVVVAARRPITVMSPLVASQIAAGEVVQRPESVVKELIENAIDAGASRITLELEQGGIELIRVIDDGAGIPEGELALALTPHATSKITAAEDLDRIATMGFRGEALASIASVARVTIRSRTATQDHAAEISAEGDSLSSPRPASGPVGTSVTVRNLFFNTPARRKFLRTPSTEQGRCLDVIRSLALSHPGISFFASADGRASVDAPGPASPRERCLAILGEELDSQFIEIGADEHAGGALARQAAASLGRAGVTLWGLVGLPSIARASAAAQHFFVNARAIKDRSIQHAVKEAYRGLIEPTRYPTCVIMIEMPPGAVDVNVHPAKAEVRFRDSSLVHQTVYHAVKRALQAADLTPSVEGAWGGSPMGGGGILPAPGADRTGLSASSSPSPAALPARSINPAAFVERFKQIAPTYGGEQARVHFDAMRRAVAAADAVTASMPQPIPHAAPSAPTNSNTPPDQLLDATPTSPALQVHNSFLVTQDSSGVVIIDQHALHERVMFQKLLARVTGEGGAADGAPVQPRALESQSLLLPETVEASPRHLESLAALQPMLKRLGIDAQPLGPTSIGIHAFSSFLYERGVEAGPFLSEVLDRAIDQGWDAAPAADAATSSEAILHEVLDMMACKAAIKAGDRLSDIELAELLTLRETIERASNCPHGRPTSIRLSIKELEKRFGRT